MPACPPARAGMSFLRKLGKRGLTNAAMRGIIYLAFAGVAHLVERDLAKVEVASSSLVARSKKNTPSDRMGYSFWNAAGRLELAASTCAQQRTDCCRISRRAACPQAAAVYRRCLRLPRGGVRAPRPTHERVKPFRRGRRPRRPVSAAVPRWERIPASLRAAKQVPLGYSSE